MLHADDLRAAGHEPLSLLRRGDRDGRQRTVGYRYDPDGSVEVPFTPIFPYDFDGAGAINSTVDDLSRWMRLHLANGSFEGKSLVSAENLAVTKTARVGLNDKLAYAMGWVLQSTPNGTITWHNGGTPSFGAYIGTALDHDVGVIVLTNLQNVGFPDAVGEWTSTGCSATPRSTYAAQKLAAAKAAAAERRRGLRARRRPGAAAAARPARRRLHESRDRATPPSPSTATACGSTSPPAPAFGSSRATATLHRDAVAEGRFKPVVEMIGPLPVAFAQFLVDQTGAPGTLPAHLRRRRPEAGLRPQVASGQADRQAARLVRRGRRLRARSARAGSTGLPAGLCGRRGAGARRRATCGCGRGLLARRRRRRAARPGSASPPPGASSARPGRRA